MLSALPPFTMRALRLGGGALRLSAQAWVAMIYHVAFATAVTCVLWYRLLASASATAASLPVLAVPVVGVLGAMALVGDRPSAADWLGFALVLGGSALVVLRLPQRAHTPASA